MFVKRSRSIQRAMSSLSSNRVSGHPAYPRQAKIDLRSQSYQIYQKNRAANISSYHMHSCAISRSPLIGGIASSSTISSSRLQIPQSYQYRNTNSQAYYNSIHHPEVFWKEASRDIHWFDDNFKSILNRDNPPFYRWFSGGKLNTCYNCIDRHIDEGHGDRAALIYDSPVTNIIKKYSYLELRREIVKLAQTLLTQGVKKGDRVLIYMPNIPEAVMAMLACARIGAVHSVVFGGFAAPELATRIRDCKPSIVISTSVGVDGSKIIQYKPLLDQAIELASDRHVVTKTIILQRAVSSPCNLIAGRDLDWQSSLDAISKDVTVPCTPVESTDPLYILYTSGTTGSPKGVLRDNGGHAVALKWAMKSIFNVHPGEVFWAASDVGWVVGHSFSVYGPLLQGCTTLIYEGKPVGTPDAKNFWRTIERHKVVSFFTAPTALRAMKREDRHGDLASGFNLSHLRSLFLAGEHADKDTLHWAEHNVHVPVIDNWWQTEVT
jgi:propionyl-CoA synthetase